MTDDITSDENQKGLSEVLNQGVVWIPPPSNYNFDDLEKALSEVYKKYPQMNTPSLKNLENRLEEFIERLETENWTNYKWSDAAALALDYFSSSFAKENQWNRVTEDFFEQLKKDKKSFVKGCFNGYLGGFRENSSLTKRLATALKNCEASSSLSFSDFIDKFQAFEPQGLIDRITEELVEHEKPYQKLKELGIANPHMQGLFNEVFVTLLEKLENRLSEQEISAFESVKNWLNPDKNIVMESGQSRGIEALLKPFLKNDPKGDLREDILGFLVENFGDPRLSRARWGEVGEEYLKLVFRWITQDSLTMFFDIIDRYEESKQWEKRRPFWEKMFDDGLIDSAWVILSRSGAVFAEERASNSTKLTVNSFAKIRNVSQDQTCYFIMKIRRLTVIEGSHNFSIRFFKENNKFIPQMYQQRYYKEELAVSPKKLDERIPHDPPGRWRSKAKNYIDINKNRGV